MASPNRNANILFGQRWFAPALRFGSVMLTGAWVAGAALAGERASPPAAAPGDADRPRQSGPAPEDDASKPLAQELAGARREVELLKHLSQEHDRAQRLEQDLASARRDIDAQTALAAKTKDEFKKVSEAVAANLKQAAQKERERAEALAANLSKVRLELYANQAQAAKAVDEAAELRRQIADSGPARQSASEDKDRIAKLEHDLAAALRDLDGRTTSLAKVRDEAAQLKKVSEANNADLKQAMQKERERAEALAGELAKVRADLQANRVQATKAAEKAAELRSEIATAATARQSMATEKEHVAASLRQQVRLERSRAESLERDLAAANLRLKDSSKVAATLGQGSPSVQEAPVAIASVAGLAAAIAAPAVKPTPDRPTPEMAAASIGLVARASSLLGQGDIIGARNVLERAAEMGSAQASFALAETYDPSVLAKWHTYGTRGDPVMARNFYTKAVAGGIKEAKERAEALRR